MTPPFLEKRLRPAFHVYPMPAFPIPWGAFWLRLFVASWYLLAAVAGFMATSLSAKAFFHGRSSTIRTGVGLGAAVLGATTHRSAIALWTPRPSPFAKSSRYRFATAS